MEILFRQIGDPQLLHNLFRMAVAYLIAFPIGWDREQSARHFGLRTFPLVSLVSCGYMLTGIAVLGEQEAQARVMQGLITGIGFVGGGAILKSRGNVRGTATAASIWNTGAIGMAVAWGRLEIALVLGLVNFLTLRLVKTFKQKVMHVVEDQEG